MVKTRSDDDAIMAAERDIRKLEAKMASYSQIMKTIYDASLLTSISNANAQAFMAKCSTIDKIRSEFLSFLDQKIDLELSLDSDKIPDYSSLNEFENMYAQIKYTASTILGPKDPLVVKSECDKIPNISQSSVKLPRLELPSFNGEIDSWPLFYETFKSVIDENQTLNKTEKMQYLVGRLEGKALGICKGIIPTGENYAVLWEALCSKYNDRRSLAVTYLDQLLNLKPLTHATPAALEKFADQYSTTLSALRQLQIDNLEDFIFVHMGLKSLDVETVRCFEMSIRGSQYLPSSKQLIDFVREQQRVLSRAESARAAPAAPSGSRATHTGAPRPSMKESRNNYKTFVNVKSEDQCTYCSEGNHFLFRCDAFNKLSPQERYNFVKGANPTICFNCLSGQHSVRYCKSSHKCRFCSQPHHSLLHFEQNTFTQTRPSYNMESSHQFNESSRGYPNKETPPRVALCSIYDQVSHQNISPHNNLSSQENALHTDTNHAITIDNEPEFHQNHSCVHARCPENAPHASEPPAPHVGMVREPPASAPAACVATREPRENDLTVLLGTAVCLAQDSTGNLQPIRVLIDSGSQKDIITSKCCARLNLPIESAGNNIHVSGIGNVTNKIQGLTRFNIFSRFNKTVMFKLQPYVVETIAAHLPTARVNTDALSFLTCLPLADDGFATPAEVDMILSSDVFSRVLLPNKISRSSDEPVAVETLFGYLILGNAPTKNAIESSNNHAVTCCAFTPMEDTCLSRFFELEDLPTKTFLSPEEQECENTYKDTTIRDDEGRYEVALPLRCDPSILGNSLPAAERRYLSLERRLLSTPAVKLEYDKIIIEYLEKGYISPVNLEEADSSRYVIPHHAVIRDDKLTTKTRMVLDASMKTDSGYSLNDILHTGKNLQTDLFRIILDFRLGPIAVNADIRQMYLRILVQNEFRPYQRILYRFDVSEPVQLFEFNRVTFGMSCSPFLAMRTVRQLAADERQRFPLAAEAIERDSLYMDDLALSCASVNDAVILSNQLIELFDAGGFELVKFSSNSPELMSAIPRENRVTELVEFGPDENLKVLGLHWTPASDEFVFSVTCDQRNCTKRNILSTIARLWDLMGFVAPVTLLAKLIIKSLWEYGIDWDDVPPPQIEATWQQYVEELPLLRHIKFPRFLGFNNPRCAVTLLGFCDASERAYGGVVYIHVYDPVDNESTISLLCSKSKVAPAKTVSLARLELCGALILSQLMRTVIETYSNRCQFRDVLAFCDSTVALTWIHSSPAKWQTFVANRVAKIQANLDRSHFHHIKGIDNPADCLSRGLMPSRLLEHPLWFNGPSFATFPREEWPIQDFDSRSVTSPPEIKANVFVTTETREPTPPLLIQIANRVSTWIKLIRVIVYVYRFIKKIGRRFDPSQFEVAEFAIIKDVQQAHFSSIFKLIRENRPLPRKFAKLRVFVHDDVLRVGGRLTHADLDFDSRHPILLPARDHVVNLLIDHYHKRHLHTGAALLQSIMRQKYYILSARGVIRQRVFKCNICFKTNPKHQFPIMGDLPECRVREAKAFLHTGVDYAGPLQIIPYRRRGVKSQKAYIVLFVCLVTHAVHIELASDLSTEVFLHAFKRFLSRRGAVSVMYSDCGTNFVGAKSYLKSLYQMVNSDSYNEEVTRELSYDQIQWKLNPPSSPHFGAIWESNVKCVKTHLHKIVGNQLLTYEEMQTVLAQIEALLNSRPLTVLSGDPSDPMPLTPAHFLTLTPLRSLPAPDVNTEKVSFLQRKQLVDHMVQAFWKRWRVEYLNTLQSRQKWNTPSNPVCTGTVVLVKNDNEAPLRWPMGIVIKTYPGADGVIRVVDVKTKTGTYRRAVVKLCPLPSQ